ncbi:hypothetical protein [Methylobacterium mesophilicum]|uniref:hypothetical protein n=1 Tax=Methylobacterium mesophilicum TaxID=39956 RepID=UPI002F3100D3
MTSGHFHDVIESEDRRGERLPEDDRLAGQISDHLRRVLHNVAKDPNVSRQAILPGQDEHPSRRHMVNGLDPAALTALFAAGGVGFGLAWLIFGQPWHRTDHVARRMSHSSERMM